METKDCFEEIGRYYDGLMEHVNYSRWVHVCTSLASLLPVGFRHLDAACGTGTLIKRLRRAGWTHCFGMDLSQAMLRAGRKHGDPFPSAMGDLRALPFADESFHFVSCLFDSVNFLLHEDELQACFVNVARVLKPGGMFYFDIVTQRMVIQHFAGQEWTEENPGFKSTWNSRYDQNAKIIQTDIRVNQNAEGTVRERIYECRDVEVMLARAGLTLLCAADAAGWRNRTHKTVRIDFVAAKNPSRDFIKDFGMAYTRVRKGLSNYAQ